MKFWQKVFLLTLALFLVVFDGSILLMANTAFNNSLNSEKERSLGEHYFILSSIAEDINALQSRNNSDAVLQTLLSTYSNYYKGQQVYLELLKGGRTIFSNLPEFSGERIELNINDEYRKTVLRSVGGVKYFYVAGKLPKPFNEYTLVYAHDISKITESQNRLTKYLTSISILASLLLSAALYLILRKLTKPIAELSAITKRIAKGELNERAAVAGKDEFSELAVNFNHMADKVLEQIKELEDAAERKQQFIDNLAHELRTPLTTIYGYAEYIQKAAISEDDRITATEYIMSESKRLREIAFKLLDLALLNHGELKIEEVRIDELFDKSLDTVRRKAEEKLVTIETDAQLTSIKGDAALLESLIVNLLDNAIKACSIGGSVGLYAYMTGNQKVLEVKDNGCGMTQEQLEHITEPFYRTDKSRSRAQGGAGLGLSLCKAIAQSHNAVLEFDSKPGEGTSAKVKFTAS